VPNRIFEKGVFYDQAESKIRGLLSLFPDDKISLALAMRDPATFVPAVFAKSKAATFKAYMKGYHRIRNTAPQCELTVWCNEDTPLLWPRLIRTLAGVSDETTIDGGYDLLASIMSTEGMTRMLSYMRSHPPKSEGHKHKIIAAFLDKYAIEDEMEEVVDIPGMTQESVAELTALYDEDVARIGDMDDVNLLLP